MTTLYDRGRCRLMLRIPAWRAELRMAMHPNFLEVCQDYEIVWQLALGDGREAAEADQLSELIEYLESEALYLAIEQQRPSRPAPSPPR